MKRFVAMILLALVAIQGCAMASGLVYFDDYAAQWATVTSEEWTGEGSVQMLAVDVGVTVSVCLEGNTVMAVTVETPIGGGSADYAYTAFDALGWLSEEALATLGNMYVDDVMTADGCVVYALGGETREGYAICAEEDAPDCVWIPVYGGEKRHTNPGCSGMDIPRLVTEKAAKSLGYNRCKRCQWAR